VIKVITLLILFLILSNCSVDTKTGVWENKNKPKNTKSLSNLEFGYDTTFNEFKENAVQYGKLSDYPKLDN
tara:strand:+ start:395 stop:607 length:213 start_codon:yes stop_codon:yes gene_type:complete